MKFQHGAPEKLLKPPTIGGTNNSVTFHLLNGNNKKIGIRNMQASNIEESLLGVCSDDDNESV